MWKYIFLSVLFVTLLAGALTMMLNRVDESGQKGAIHAIFKAAGVVDKEKKANALLDGVRNNQLKYVDDLNSKIQQQQEAIRRQREATKRQVFDLEQNISSSAATLINEYSQSLQNMRAATVSHSSSDSLQQMQDKLQQMSDDLRRMREFKHNARESNEQALVFRLKDFSREMQRLQESNNRFIGDNNILQLQRIEDLQEQRRRMTENLRAKEQQMRVDIEQKQQQLRDTLERSKDMQRMQKDRMDAVKQRSDDLRRQMQDQMENQKLLQNR